MGRDGTERRNIRCEIKALAGNSATCLGFCFRLDAGSIPAASISRSPIQAAALPLLVFPPLVEMHAATDWSSLTASKSNTPPDVSINRFQWKDRP